MTLTMHPDPINQPAKGPKERAVLDALASGPVALDTLADQHGAAVGNCYRKGLIGYDETGSPHTAQLAGDQNI